MYARPKKRARGRLELDKVVVKTAVKTILIILAVLVVVFAVFNFAFPQHMASLTEKMGNYNLAVKYAALRYKYTRDGDDLARCFDDSVLLGNDKYIIEYGEELIDHEDFEEVCQSKNSKYKTFPNGKPYNYRFLVVGKVAVAYYNTGKSVEAVNMAAEENGTTSFADHNPLVILASAVKAKKDAIACALVLEKLDNITPQLQEDINYLEKVKKEVKTSLGAVTAQS